MPARKKPLSEKLDDSHYQVVTESGCWIWTGHGFMDGYGGIWHNNRPCLAHRGMYEFHFGPIPDGMWVLHKCDVKQCVNPAHLYLGDSKQNAKDRYVRGRTPRGEKSHSHVLEEKQVREILELSKTESMNALARKYGVSGTQIRRIVSRQSWAHV